MFIWAFRKLGLFCINVLLVIGNLLLVIRYTPFRRYKLTIYHSPLINYYFWFVSADTILAPRSLALYYESTEQVLYQTSNKSQEETAKKLATRGKEIVLNFEFLVLSCGGRVVGGGSLRHFEPFGYAQGRQSSGQDASLRAGRTSFLFSV